MRDNEHPEIEQQNVPEVEQETLPEFEQSTEHPDKIDTRVKSEELRYENADRLYE
jgi:hypothetical protein